MNAAPMTCRTSWSLWATKRDWTKKAWSTPKKKPQIVTESMREFSKDRYGVDVLKVEVPVNMKFVEGVKSFGGQKAYSKKEAIDLFHKAASVATKPFIYLSAGVSNAEFSETLELAGETGVKFNGVLCGRATWKEGIPIYAKQGADAFRKWLETEGVKNINNVNDKLKTATSWHSIYEVEPLWLAHRFLFWICKGGPSARFFFVLI